MKPTVMPAYRLTASCIWRSFRSSGKKHLILTGDRGAGKTTLLNRLFPQLPPGITTWAQPKQAVFLRENTSGRQVQVGVFNPSLPGPGNQMVLLPEGFSGLGVPALKRCMASSSPWITVDEIGYLEAGCSLYRQALLQLLEAKQVAAVVRKQSLPFLQALCRREDVFLVDLDDPFGPLGCVIMASGLGLRFGGNKLMADFQGQPLISRVLDATEAFASHRVVVTRHADVARFCRDREIPAVMHTLAHRSDTVRLGLEALGEVRGCMFCPGDQPLLSADTAMALALAFAGDPESLWRTAWEDIPGSPVVFPQWTFSQLRSLPQGRGGNMLIQKYPQHLRFVGARDKYELMDVDTPEDLALLAGK